MEETIFGIVMGVLILGALILPILVAIISHKEEVNSTDTNMPDQQENASNQNAVENQ